MEFSRFHPLAGWREDGSGDSRLVWLSRIHGRFQIEVQRTGFRTGVLCVFDHEKADLALFAEVVRISGRSLFLGPSYEELQLWRGLVERFIEDVWAA